MIMRNHLERLNAFIAQHNALGDWHEFSSRDRSRLLRRAVCAHCGFPRSTLYQNPAVKEGLSTLESDLRRRKVLTSQEDVNFVQCSSVLLDLNLEQQVKDLKALLCQTEGKLVACRAFLESFHPSRFVGEQP